MKKTKKDQFIHQDQPQLNRANQEGFALMQVFILATMISILLSTSLLMLKNRREQDNTLDQAATRDSLAQILTTSIKSASNLSYSVYDYNAGTGAPVLASARIQGGSITSTPTRFTLLAPEESFASNPNLGTWIASKRVTVPTSSGSSLSMVKLTDLGTDASGSQSYYNSKGEPCIGSENDCVMVAEAFVSRTGSMAIGSQSLNQLRFEVRLRARPESQLNSGQTKMVVSAKTLSVQNQVLESELNQVSRIGGSTYNFVGLRVGGALQPGMIQTGVTFQGGSEVGTGIFELGATPCSTDTLHVGTTFNGYPRCAGGKTPCPPGQVMVGFANTGSGPQVQCRAMNNCENISGKPGAMIPLVTDVGTTSCIRFEAATGCESRLKTTVNSNGKLTCGNAVCTPGTWTPAADQVCSGQTFTQIDTNGCLPSRSANGTKNCSSCPIDTPWTPLVTDVCAGSSYIQTRCDVTRPATGTKNCTPNCADTSWTPALDTYCPSEMVVQTSNCGRTRSLSGTKPEQWTPDPATVCSTAPPFEQISNCNGKRTATGTLTCTVPNCSKTSNFAPSSFSCSANGTGYNINQVCPTGTSPDNSDVLRAVLGNECSASAAPTSVGNLVCCSPSTTPPETCGGTAYQGPARQDQCQGTAIGTDGYASSPRINSALTAITCPANQKLVCDQSKQQFMQFNVGTTPPICGHIPGQTANNKTTFYLPNSCSCQNAAECGSPTCDASYSGTKVVVEVITDDEEKSTDDCRGSQFKTTASYRVDQSNSNYNIVRTTYDTFSSSWDCGNPPVVSDPPADNNSVVEHQVVGSSGYYSEPYGNPRGGFAGGNSYIDGYTNGTRYIFCGGSLVGTPSTTTTTTTKFSCNQPGQYWGGYTYTTVLDCEAKKVSVCGDDTYVGCYGVPNTGSVRACCSSAEEVSTPQWACEGKAEIFQYPTPKGIDSCQKGPHYKYQCPNNYYYANVKDKVTESLLGNKEVWKCCPCGLGSSSTACMKNVTCEMTTP